MEFGDFQCYNRNHLFRGIGARKTEVPLLLLADLVTTIAIIENVRYHE